MEVGTVRRWYVIRECWELYVLKINTKRIQKTPNPREVNNSSKE